MASHLILSMAIVAVALLAPRAAGYPWPVCGTTGSFAAKSKYLANIELIAATLPNNASTSPDLFATAKDVGAIPDQVSALALCRGDADATSCFSCLAQAFSDLPNACPYNKDATIYYDSCMLHYSNILSADDSGTPVTYRLAANVTSEPDRFSRVMATLVNATADYAAYNYTRRYASGEADFNQEFPEVYSWAQCTPDLTPAQCRQCLARNTALLVQLFPYRIGARILSVRCTVRYETRPFYVGPVMVGQAASSGAPALAVVPTVNVTPAAAGGGKKRSAAGIPAGVVCSVLFVLIISVFVFIRFRRRNKATEDDHPLKKITRAQCTIFDLPALQEATENFSEKNKLGEGGFGTVYKGILSDGQEIAVKKLLGTSGHGLHQLHNEVLVLAELQHKNLVRLQGFCLHRDETLLVYEYIKNGSLDSFLFDASRGDALNWEQQYNIILGIAKGILYLHEDSSMRIIHRDLKANNILLDEDMEPKIADFGLARLLQEGHTHTRTSRVVGTLGYMAPEYAIHGNVSPKIDIFSFGVLVLEIVTRRRNCSSDDHDAVNLLSDVWNCWTKGTISQMMDQSLDGYSRSQALRCIHIGLLCVQSDPDDRPHISSAIFMLTRDNMEVQPPAQPAFFFGRESTLASPSYGQRSYVYDRSDSILEDDITVNGVTITEPYPR